VIVPEVAPARIIIIPAVTVKAEKPNLPRIIDEIVVVKQVIRSVRQEDAIPKIAGYIVFVY
jgi:hypothetical protein